MRNLPGAYWLPDIRASLLHTEKKFAQRCPPPSPHLASGVRPGASNKFIVFPRPAPPSGDVRCRRAVLAAQLQAQRLTGGQPRTSCDPNVLTLGGAF
jgi:hypothetical protein